MSKPSLSIKSRVWIIGNQGTFLGEGRIALLHAIGEFGSISKAARSMNMSYLKAWKLVNSMNGEVDQPLVIRVVGGSGGGGSTLTEKGKEAIRLYEKLNSKCREFLKRELEKLIAKE